MTNAGIVGVWNSEVCMGCGWGRACRSLVLGSGGGRWMRCVIRVRMLISIHSMTCCRGRATPTVMTRATSRPIPLPAIAAIMSLATRATAMVTTALRTRARVTVQVPAPTRVVRQAAPQRAVLPRPMEARLTAQPIAKERLQQRRWGGSRRWRRVRSSAAPSAITATGALRRNADATVAE